jgi:hypothetical protein
MVSHLLPYDLAFFSVKSRLVMVAFFRLKTLFVVPPHQLFIFLIHFEYKYGLFIRIILEKVAFEGLPFQYRSSVNLDQVVIFLCSLSILAFVHAGFVRRCPTLSVCLQPGMVVLTVHRVENRVV